MGRAILVFNAGSSSLKFSEFEVGPGGALEARVSGSLEELCGAALFSARGAHGEALAQHRWPGDAPLEHAGAIRFVFDWLRTQGGGHEVMAVGHRVVHGGAAHTEPVLVDAGVLAQLADLVPLAPLHQPHNLLPIRMIAEQQPRLAQVACFDTAFHAGAPALSQAFALPPALTGRGVRRYGFHGLSYEYIASVLADIDPRAAAGRTVVLHLGNGASACALQAGRSIATTMGFTAVDGLMMGTRCGALDPGVILYLMQQLKMDAQSIESLLYRESGLLGVSGVSSDMRVLLASSEPAARWAVDLFVHRITREIGSLAAVLGGLDALVFTAGIGEHAAAVREAVCRQAAWLGLQFDAAANAGHGPLISTPASAVAAWVVPTDEELMIARHVLRLAGG